MFQTSISDEYNRCGSAGHVYLALTLSALCEAETKQCI